MFQSTNSLQIDFVSTFTIIKIVALSDSYLVSGVVTCVTYMSDMSLMLWCYPVPPLKRVSTVHEGMNEHHVRQALQSKLSVLIEKGW